MKAIVLQSNLNNAIADVAPAVPGKPTIPVVGNYLIKAEGELLTISGTDLEVGITRRVGAKVFKPGAVTVPAKLFNDVIGALSEGEVTLTLDASTQILTIACGGFENEINGISADEFPTIPTGVKDLELTRLPAEELHDALEQVVFAAAENDARPVLNGVLMQIADRIMFAATDSFRMAIKYLALRTAPPADAKRLIIPASSLNALIKLLKGSKDEVIITTTPGGAQLVFKTLTAELVTRLIDGQYPQLEKAVSPTFATRLTIEADEMAKAAKLASFFAAHSQNVVKLTAKGGGLVISANAAQVGKNKGDVPATLEGQEGQIALNVKYLGEAIGAAGKKNKITIDFQSAQSPGILRREGDDSWIGIIMAMSIR